MAILTIWAWAAIRAAGGWLWQMVCTPLGRVVAAALAALLALWLAYHAGVHAGQAACEAAHRLAADQSVRRQIVAASGAVQRAETAAVTAVAADNRNKGVVRDVAIRAAALPGGSDVCVSADVADRLRDLE